MKLAKIVALVIVLLACQIGRAESQYGQVLSGAVPIRIAQLLDRPDDYVDQRVKIEGLIDDVCPAKGCWVDILANQSKQTIRFKVQDDVIVFPTQAKGETVVAEGILRKHMLSKAQAVRHMRHLADEKGEDFDKASVTGPMAFYQIEGIGAVVGSASEIN